MDDESALAIARVASFGDARHVGDVGATSRSMHFLVACRITTLTCRLCLCFSCYLLGDLRDGPRCWCGCGMKGWEVFVNMSWPSIWRWTLLVWKHSSKVATSDEASELELCQSVDDLVMPALEALFMRMSRAFNSWQKPKTVRKRPAAAISVCRLVT